MKIVYSMYRASEVSVHRACCERATLSYSLGGGGTIYPGSPASITSSLTSDSGKVVVFIETVEPLLLVTFLYTLGLFYAL